MIRSYCDGSKQALVTTTYLAQAHETVEWSLAFNKGFDLVYGGRDARRRQVPQMRQVRTRINVREGFLGWDNKVAVHPDERPVGRQKGPEPRRLRLEDGAIDGAAVNAQNTHDATGVDDYQAGL